MYVNLTLLTGPHKMEFGEVLIGEEMALEDALAGIESGDIRHLSCKSGAECMLGKGVVYTAVIGTPAKEPVPYEGGEIGETRK